MELIYRVLLWAGPVALLLAAAAAIYYFVRRLRARHVTVGAVLVYVLGVVGAALGGWALGSMIGIFAACGSPGASNLCGLMGVFGLGPLAAAIAVFLYARWWGRRGARDD